MKVDRPSEYESQEAGNHASPRKRMLKVAVFSALVGAVAGGLAVYGSLHRPDLEKAAAPVGESKVEPQKAEKKPLYQCPMHPAITSDHPSDCPICGMKLVLVESNAPEGEESAVPSGERKLAFYRSPMDPKQTSPTPRKDEMGMDYVPVYEDELKGGGKVEGLAVVTIDPERQQLIGLRTAKVEKGPIGTSWRTSARIQVAPTLVRQINVKVDGFVEKVFVDFVGKKVRKGQPLFSLYSPSLLSAQNEFLLALRTSEALAQGKATSEQGKTLIHSARRRLELWDIPSKEIDRLERTREPTKTLTLVSPIAGVVTAKNVVQGARVSVGEAPYEITDLSEVWVMADAYEADLGRIRVGMKATLTLPAYPDRSFSGEVAFIDPLLDAKSRTTKVHLHFANRSGELKPEMFGEVTLQGGEREGLRIPMDAVIRTGTRDVVFVARDKGKFEPKVVRLGSKDGEQVEVVEGVAEGQEVVTRANFLVDSESQLRSSLSALGGK